MKKGILFMMGFLITLIMCFTSCGSKYDPGSTYEDSTQVTPTFPESVSYTNPTFTSVVDIVCFSDSVCKKFESDSVFRSMDAQVLANVAHVLIYRNGSCTIQDVVDEYLLHKDIYSNLPQNNSTDSIPVKGSASQDDSSVHRSDLSKR